MRSPDSTPPNDRADVQFDFGENWKSFSVSALEPEKVEEARREFHDLLLAGFERERVIPAVVPAGSKQFVFKKTPAAIAASDSSPAS